MYSSLVALYRENAPKTADKNNMDDAQIFFNTVEVQTHAATNAILAGGRLVSEISSFEMVVSRQSVTDSITSLNMIDLRKHGIRSLQQWINEGEVSTLKDYIITKSEVQDPAQMALVKSFMEARGGEYVGGKYLVPGEPTKRIRLEAAAGPLLSFFLPRYDHDGVNDLIYLEDYHFIYEPVIRVADQLYELHALIHFHNRHYKTYTRSANHLEQWLCFNNDEVSVVSKQEVLGHLGHAYMLFYAKADWLPIQDATEPPLPLSNSVEFKLMQTFENTWDSLMGHSEHISKQLGIEQQQQQQSGEKQNKADVSKEKEIKHKEDIPMEMEIKNKEDGKEKAEDQMSISASSSCSRKDHGKEDVAMENEESEAWNSSSTFY